MLVVALRMLPFCVLWCFAFYAAIASGDWFVYAALIGVTYFGVLLLKTLRP